MISAIDSLVTWLNQELANEPPVNWVRVDPENPDSNTPKENALNVSMLSVEEDEGSTEVVLVSLDILNYSERTAWRWAKSVRELLLNQALPEFDFEDGDPIALGKNAYWCKDDISFTVVRSDANYLHLSTVLPLKHSRF